MINQMNRRRSAIPTKSLFLLGQSADGPVNQPIIVANRKEAVAAFGSGNLLEAYDQVQGIAGISVHLMRITGEYARLSLLGESGAVLTLRSVNAGAKYNAIRVYVDTVERSGVANEALIVESPVSGESARSYILSDYADMSELASHINKDAYLKRGHVFAVAAEPQFPAHQLPSLNSDILMFEGGEDGTDATKDELFLALEDTYDLLQGRNVDVICPYPVRLDDIHPSVRYGEASAVYGQVRYGSGDYLALVDEAKPDYPLTFHEQLIEFCQGQEHFGIMTHGVIGMSEVVAGDAMSPHYIARLAGATAFSDRYGLTDYVSGKYVDKGHYISVYGQDIRYGELVRNGCAMYAGMIAALGPAGSTTNTPLPPGVELAYELSPQELRALAEIGVVAARGSVRRGLVISNGVTAGLPSSPLHQIGNVRMVQQTLATLNEALGEMVGEPYVPSMTVRSIEDRTQKALVGLVNTQVLTDFDFSVTMDGTTMRAQVELELRPRFSVEYIKSSSVIDFAGGGGDSQ